MFYVWYGRGNNCGIVNAFNDIEVAKEQSDALKKHYGEDYVAFVTSGSAEGNVVYKSE